MLRNAVRAVLVSSSLVFAAVACGPCGSDSADSAIVVNVVPAEDAVADEFHGPEGVAAHRMTGFSGLGDASVAEISVGASGCLTTKSECSIGAGASSDCRIAETPICGTYDCDDADCGGDCKPECETECSESDTPVQD